jgi:hypothetical protein
MMKEAVPGIRDSWIKLLEWNQYAFDEIWKKRTGFNESDYR